MAIISAKAASVKMIWKNGRVGMASNVTFAGTLAQTMKADITAARTNPCHSPKSSYGEQANSTTNAPP